MVSRLGAEGKYHATLTWFFLLLIADRTEANEPWLVFRHCNEDLISDSKEILLRYYTNDYLFSARARERFVLPDRLE